MGVEVCPYCNRTYIFSSNDRRTAEFDHFIPQEKYPIFALCLFNLIPSCPICNGIKNDNESFFYNPYSSELQFDTFKFRPLYNNGTYTGIELYTNLKDQKTQKALNTLLHDLKLESLYARHKQIVDELNDKHQIYTQDYVEELKNRYFSFFQISKSRQEDFIRFVLGYYGCEEDYYKIVLSKATHDLAEFFNLLNVF